MLVNNRIHRAHLLSSPLFFGLQGVSVFPDVTRSAIVMLITILPYL